MKEIELTRGLVALVDDEDYASLMRFKWYAYYDKRRGTMYAVRGGGKGANNVRMHRQILDAPDGVEVDHRNRNGLDNTRSNIRLATRLQNTLNRRRPAKSKSRFRGVHQHKDGGWVAQAAGCAGKRYLGLFESEEDAARAYDKAMYPYREFAQLNFPAVEA